MANVALIANVSNAGSEIAGQTLLVIQRPDRYQTGIRRQPATIESSPVPLLLLYFPTTYATVNSEIELGIISVGTGNDLARSLGLPYNKPEKALEVILTGGHIKVDVGWEAKYTEGIRVPGMEEIDLGEFIS